MSSDRRESAMDEMSVAECYQKLASGLVGRIGVVVDRYPLIIPVNYVVDGETVVIRTARDTVIARADHTRVTVQADEIDVRTQTGWSVLLKGRGTVVGAEDVEGASTRPPASVPTPWAPGDRDLWIRIIPDEISGRRITRGSEQEWRLDSAAYL